MKLDVYVHGKKVAQLYRQSDDYFLSYLEGAESTDFVSLTMPGRQDPWRWPRDLHPFLGKTCLRAICCPLFARRSHASLIRQWQQPVFLILSLLVQKK